ncbi:MAG TPA: SRPBCC family protein [Anaerolineales bacterium]|jgi:uncharacterized protein YndB with AHSA1/START domain
MGISICPTAVVAAPLESVWELLADPALYDEWWDAHTERIDPPGRAAPGQVLQAKTSALGRHWDVTLKIEMVDPQKHQLRFTIILPLGTVNHQTTTLTAIDSVSCRLQFG